MVRDIKSYKYMLWQRAKRGLRNKESVAVMGCPCLIYNHEQDGEAKKDKAVTFKKLSLASCF